MAKISAPAPIYCLDSCCLIDWLKNATDCQNRVNAVELLWSDAKQKKCGIVIPAVVVAELLPSKCGNRLPDFLRLRQMQTSVRTLDFAVGKTVAELREDLGAEGKGRTVDIMILATAICNGANVLYTGDGGILNLNKRVAALTRNRPADGFKIRKIEEHLHLRDQELPLASGNIHARGAD